MPEEASEQRRYDEEQAGNPAVTIPGPSIFSYYRDDNPETSGLEVKWTVRVAAGAEARRLDDRQNQAIRELLSWARRYRQHST